MGGALEELREALGTDSQTTTQDSGASASASGSGTEAEAVEVRTRLLEALLGAAAEKPRAALLPQVSGLQPGWESWRSGVEVRPWLGKNCD